MESFIVSLIFLGVILGLGWLGWQQDKRITVLQKQMTHLISAQVAMYIELSPDNKKDERRKNLKSMLLEVAEEKRKK